MGTDTTLDKAPADGWAEHHQCEVRGLAVGHMEQYQRLKLTSSDASSGGMWHALKGYKRCIVPAQG